MLLLVDGDDDADGAAHAALLPAFLLETGDIHLAFRRAVAFQAALVHFERLNVAKAILPLEGGDAEPLGDGRIGVERIERLRFELVGNVLLAARIEVRVADDVVAARREQAAHALAHHRAMQALELVDAVGRGVDDGLRIVHELPDGVHLARERARLLEQGRLGLLLLRVEVEQRERKARHGEGHRQNSQVDGLQTERALPHTRPHFASCTAVRGVPSTVTQAVAARKANSPGEDDEVLAVFSGTPGKTELRDQSSNT